MPRASRCQPIGWRWYRPPTFGSGQFYCRRVHLHDGPVEIDVIELAAQYDGVRGCDEYLRERQRRDQEGSTESVDALDDEPPQRLDHLRSLGGHPFPCVGVSQQIEGELES